MPVTSAMEEVTKNAGVDDQPEGEEAVVVSDTLSKQQPRETGNDPHQSSEQSVIRLSHENDRLSIENSRLSEENNRLVIENMSLRDLLSDKKDEEIQRLKAELVAVRHDREVGSSEERLTGDTSGRAEREHLVTTNERLEKHADRLKDEIKNTHGEGEAWREELGAADEHDDALMAAMRGIHAQRQKLLVEVRSLSTIVDHGNTDSVTPEDRNEVNSEASRSAPLTNSESILPQDQTQAWEEFQMAYQSWESVRRERREIRKRLREEQSRLDSLDAESRALRESNETDRRAKSDLTKSTFSHFKSGIELVKERRRAREAALAELEEN